MDKVTDKLNKSNTGRIVLDGIIREVVKTRQDAFALLEEAARSVHSATSAKATPVPEATQEAESEQAQVNFVAFRLHVV